MSDTRYIDGDGDIWKDRGTGYATCVVRHGEPIEDGITTTLADLVKTYGPISLAPTAVEEIRSHVRDVIAEWLPGSRDYGHVRVTSQEGGDTTRVTVSEDRWGPGVTYMITVGVREVDA